jgi:hypothetical protein
MVRVPLSDFATAVLDNNGNGTAHLGISSARETWYPDHIAVKVNSMILESKCFVYVGPDATDQYFRGRTITGSSGDTSRVQDVIRSGVYIWAKWAGGDPGAIGTVTVTGEKEI